MSSGNSQYCKRFKGVENFLRRIAFNLGNSPSQTDVKIISCIPIDVTELQQKIVELERDLREAKHCTTTRILHIDRKKEIQDAAAKDTAFGPCVVKPNDTVTVNVKYNETINPEKHPADYCECVTNQKSSIISFDLPAIKKVTNEEMNTLTQNTPRNKGFNESSKNIFRKCKIKKKVNKDMPGRTQLVYYAQTPPYRQTLHNVDELSFSTTGTTLRKHEQLSRSYLNNVFRKHHDPTLVLKQFSDTSNFSKPICSDCVQREPFTNASDVCSCCQGKFHNLNSYMTGYLTFEPRKTNVNTTNANNYDTYAYDTIPVKENTIKHTRVENLPKFESFINKCSPQRKYPTSKYQTFMVNYELERLNKKKCINNDKHNTKKREKPKHCHIKSAMANNNVQLNSTSSMSSSIDFSNIYKKTTKPPISKFYKNECVATDALITNPNEILKDPNLKTGNDNKTEITLNQIKDILQSVLAEVKTNSTVDSSCTKKTNTKNATVQKGFSQYGMQGASTLLNTLTYGCSYNAIPYFASCSRQISSSPYCIPFMSYDHGNLHNYPVFVHPASRRHMCGCCYRNDRYNKNNQETAATNTEVNENVFESKETEKLIKEIYKSMTLNIDYPIKDNSLSDVNFNYNSATSSNKGTTPGLELSEIFNRDQEETPTSRLTSQTAENKFIYTSFNQQTENHGKKIMDKNQSTYTDFGMVYRVGQNERNIQTIDEDNDTEESSEQESDNTVVTEVGYLENKNDKRGFLKKVFNTVKIFKKGKQTKQEDREISEVSDSDDYETVYSGVTNKVTSTKPKTKPKNVIDFRRLPMNARVKKMQNREQEYQRQWAENLMSHEQQRRYPACRPKSDVHPAFWQEYEARSALLDPQTDSRKTDKQTAEHNVKRKTVGNKLAWLKKHKLGVNCGEQWKNLILEN